MKRLKLVFYSAGALLIIALVAFNQKLIDDREQKVASVKTSEPKVTVKSFKQFIKDSSSDQTPASIEKLFKDYASSQINDEAIQAFYESDKNPFLEKVARSSHILISTNNKMTINERREKFETSQKVYAKLKSGADFTQVAMQYSDDYMTAKKGGDLGWLPEGSINPMFNQQVFKKLKPGQISKPFQSKFGFHIVKLTDSVQTEKQPLKDVKHRIQNLLILEARKERDQLLGITPGSELASSH